VASRREVERYIADGRVALNGKVLDSPAVSVGPGDILTVDGKVVGEAEPTRVFRYNKPVGLLTSHTDPKGRPTVFENLPGGLPRLISVGRLDINSEGLLLLTNDGALSRSLELPSGGWVRRYRVRARGRVTQEKLDTLKDGVTVEGVVYGAIDAKLDKAKEGPQGANLWISVAITEGKNREVRRVMEHLGLAVNRLIRLAYGPFQLGTLPAGAVEEVGPRVIRELLADRIAPEAMPKGDKVLWTAPAAAAEPRRRAAGSAGAKPGAAGEGAPAEPRAKKTYKAGWAKAKAPKPGGIGSKPKRSGPPRTAEREGGPSPIPAKAGPARPGPARTGPARSAAPSGPGGKGPGGPPAGRPAGPKRP
jgi:23S rRNA pseudouridine2605 synthase